MKKKTYSLKLVPIVFALGFIPLIVRLHIYDSGFENFDWYPASDAGIMYDFFLYSKSVLILLTAGIMLAIAGFDIAGKKTDPKPLLKKKEFIPLFCYLVFVIISGLFSARSREAFWGSPEVFEGASVITGYVIFCAYSHLYVRDETALKKILKWTFPGVMIMLLISLSQIISRDILASGFAKTLMVPSYAAELRDSLTMKFDPGISYGTLYNSNYVSQYAGFAFFISLSLVFCSSLKKHFRILAAFTALFSALFIYGSDSGSGYIAFASGMVFFICLAGISLIISKKKKTLPLPVIIAGIACLLICIAVSGISIKNKQSNDSEAQDNENTEHLIENVSTEDDCVRITVNGKELALSYEESGDGFFLNMKDENGNEPEHTLSRDGMKFRLDDDAYCGMEIYPVYCGDRLCMEVDVDEKELIFSDFGADGGYLYYNNAGKFSKFRKYERSTFFSDSLFTDRGLIWNYCLKMLPKTVFKGFGANTFVYAYPNDDDYFRLYSENEVSYFDVKAHSLYFQQAVENGLPALVFFIAFYCIYFFRSLKHYSSEGINRNDLFSCVGAGILAGSICYMTAGIANDSNVTTAPVFWILIGLGLPPLGKAVN